MVNYLKGAVYHFFELLNQFIQAFSGCLIGQIISIICRTYPESCISQWNNEYRSLYDRFKFEIRGYNGDQFTFHSFERKIVEERIIQKAKSISKNYFPGIDLIIAHPDIKNLQAFILEFLLYQFIFNCQMIPQYGYKLSGIDLSGVKYFAKSERTL